MAPKAPSEVRESKQKGHLHQLMMGLMVVAFLHVWCGCVMSPIQGPTTSPTGSPTTLTPTLAPTGVREGNSDCFLFHVVGEGSGRLCCVMIGWENKDLYDSMLVAGGEIEEGTGRRVLYMHTEDLQDE